MSKQIKESGAEPWLKIVREKVDAIRFGSVQIVIHEDRVTLVESTEKTRLAQTSGVSAREHLHASLA